MYYCTVCDVDTPYVCRDCGACGDCCDCEDEGALFDADELGLNPEDDDRRAYG